MIKISRQSDYALQLILGLSKVPKNEYLSLKKFSTESNISFLFLQKIAMHLRKAGLIEAAKGSGGGYKLLVDPSNITLRRVIEALDDHAGAAACIRGEFCSKQDKCTLKPNMSVFNSRVTALLEQTTIADFR